MPNADRLASLRALADDAAAIAAARPDLSEEDLAREAAEFEAAWELAARNAPGPRNGDAPSKESR